MIVEKTSVFPAARSEVYEKIQKLETLQYIAKPYATFTPVRPEADYKWIPGSVSSYRFRLLGFIPFGTHKIRVDRFDDEHISTHEGNEHVEIEAGWKTIFIWLWANCFYAHRQRKWIRLLREKGRKK